MPDVESAQKCALPAQNKRPQFDDLAVRHELTQTSKSIDAFAPIASFLTQERRCVNCHGDVNPFIKDTGTAWRLTHGGRCRMADNFP